MNPRDSSPFWLTFVVALPIALISMVVWNHVGGVFAAVVMLVLSLAAGITLAELRT